MLNTDFKVYSSGYKKVFHHANLLKYLNLELTFCVHEKGFMDYERTLWVALMNKTIGNMRSNMSVFQSFYDPFSLPTGGKVTDVSSLLTRTTTRRRRNRGGHSDGAL